MLRTFGIELDSENFEAKVDRNGIKINIAEYTEDEWLKSVYKKRGFPMRGMFLKEFRDLINKLYEDCLARGFIDENGKEL